MFKFKRVLTLATLTLFCVQATAGQSYVAQGNIAKAQEVYQTTFAESYASYYNGKFDLEKAIEEIKFRFPGQEDQKYVQGLMKENRAHISNSKAQLTADKGQLEINLPNGRKVVISDWQNREKNGFIKINGKLFAVDSSKSLKEHHQSLTKILEDSFSGKKAGLERLLLPSAEATWGVVAIFAMLFVLPVALKVWFLSDFGKSMDELLLACEKRDPKVPYEDSKAVELLDQLRAHGLFTLEDQRNISDCASWAAQNSRRENAPTASTLLELCSKGRKILRCMDEYKVESGQMRPRTRTSGQEARPATR